MADYTDLLSSLPLDDIARELGTDRETARTASAAAIPALLGGMRANASDPAGKASLVGALSQHDPSVVEGGVDLRDVDRADGEKVVRNVFGPASNDVTARLGASQGVSSDLFSKLLPILAPIVLSWITKNVLGSAGQSQAAPQQSGGGGLGDLLGGILGGGTSQQSGGGGLGDLLGGILGGGARPDAGAAPSSSPSSGRPGPTAGPTPPAGVDINDILADMLGGGAAPSRTSGQSAPRGGGVEDLLGSVLGGLLGGGKR
ncbi:MAG: DUF937 domain-containing protein [Actinobacteria bacterium]|nr:DUF937 domain-containing protein [Actinomycetota bacterium]